MSVHVGTSGWSYDHWADVLYPPGTPVRSRLAHYVREFDTVELNTSFYRWPAVQTFARWREQLPEGFRLSVKASRFLTHYRRLNDPDTWLQRMTDGFTELRDRRGVLLVQLRPDHERDDERLQRFLARVPPGVPVAVEFRHVSWNAEPVSAILAAHGAAYCVVSGAGMPSLPQVTAPFAYLRLHGPDSQPVYAGNYPEAELARWADHVREWSTSVDDVYVYFNNDIGGHAVRNARRLRQLLGQG